MRFESDGSLTLIRLEKISTVNRWRAYELLAAAEPRLRFDHRDSDYTVDSIYVPGALAVFRLGQGHEHAAEPGANL